MANTITVGVVSGTSLNDLNTVVGQNEDTLGPLTEIGNDGVQTLLTFDTDPPSPVNHAVVSVDNNGQPAIPSGSTQVCRGSVFVERGLVSATASRPN